ncbi:phosphatase [Harryflintia acetispora]|uniref:phosphatase n=1 Tax=Harryflintia acetispora TaxID=1849041 RepID=UPI001A9AFC27|nr:phosphatase [Harryflintia acetispora]
MIHTIADTHTHTVVSGHAYSTLTENLKAASERGLRFLGSTEHTGLMPHAAHEYYFTNMGVVPDELFGVHLLRGCEVNIIGNDGELDVSDKILSKLEWVIASMHIPVYQPIDFDGHTSAWMGVLKNPQVDVLGHPGDGRYVFDYETVIKACGEYGKIVEINSHSFGNRPGSTENCRTIALLCKKYGIPVVVNSDAHFWASIGEHTNALRMLEEIGFPEELIVNADYRRFADLITEKTGRIFE